MKNKEEMEETVMTHGFQHQNQLANFSLPKSALTPQHGEKPAKLTKVKPPRSFQPRPGH